MGRYAVSRLERTRGAGLRLVGRSGDLSLAEYSRFKHGDGAISLKYGALMAEVVLREADVESRPRIVVTSSGFDLAAPASWSLVRPFVDTLGAGLGPDVAVSAVKVHRHRPTDGDYATMGTADRRAAMAGALDASTIVPQVAGTTVIVLDDVSVTGLHEQSMETVLVQAGATSVHHVLVVDATAFRRRPEVESELNRQEVRTSWDVLRLAVRPEFVPNARVARLALALPSDELRALVDALPQHIVRWLIEVALADPLADLPRFAAGASMLRAMVPQVA